MEKVAPTRIRYIKLGAGGCWEEAALGGGRLEWGLPSDPHELMARCDWDAVREHYLAAGFAPSTASAYVNDARIFYDGDPNTLWITFARGRMFWGYADGEIHWVGGDGASCATRHRVIRGGWSDRDLAGNTLLLDRLSTRLTKLAAYRRTSCALTPDQQALCLRAINAAPDSEQAAALRSRAELIGSLSVLIQRLSWRDLEQLVDLMLARSGWQRVSSLGGHLKDVDLIVEQPLTGERMAVQVKSAADQQVVEDYSARLALRPADERLMLVCHSPRGALSIPTSTDGRRLHLLAGERIAELAIASGLTDWIIRRA